MINRLVNEGLALTRIMEIHHDEYSEIGIYFEYA